MDDRPKPGEREAGRDADHELLADADIDDPIGVPLLCARHPTDADVRENDGDALVGADQLVSRRVEAVAHRRAQPLCSTTATTACGRPSCSTVKERSSSAWSRPSTVVLDQPSTVKRAAMPPGQ